MSTYEPDSNTFSSDVGQQQITIVTQLMKVVPTMHSIDELFQWLAYAMIQHFNLQLAQFWAPVINANGVLSTNLRTMVTRDPSLPEQVILNDQVFLAVRRLAHEQRSTPSQSVDVLFPMYQATLLKRYGLNFWAGSFMNSNVLLPPPSNSLSHMQEPVLFSLTTLLFLLQPAHRDLMPTVSAILKQAVRLATNRGLLLPAPTPLPTVPATAMFAQQDLSALIPCNKESGHLMVSDNPFARTSFITDKLARRLHAAIDGRKSIGELCRSTGMDMKSISEALQTLLKMQRVELLDADRRPVNPTRFFPESDF